MPSACLRNKHTSNHFRRELWIHTEKPANFFLYYAVLMYQAIIVKIIGQSSLKLIDFAELLIIHCENGIQTDLACYYHICKEHARMNIGRI